MATRKIVLCEAVRTPIGTYDGSLKTVSAPDLGTVAIKAVLDRSKLDPAKVGTVVMGNMIQAGKKMNPARQSAVRSGTVDVPATTVNRVCRSGAQGIAQPRQCSPRGCSIRCNATASNVASSRFASVAAKASR